ncbi:MAG TPA: helix-turn-helix transcriptional regulator [Kiloniellaceae bacterium]
MPRKRARAYSTASREAARLLGQLIRLQRLERKVTAEDLADRAGITRTTLRKIEHGDLSCELGLAFEVAALVGVQLFGREPSALGDLSARLADKIALLPKTARPTAGSVDDDF